jgi:hypothetical protein
MGAVRNIPEGNRTYLVPGTGYGDDEDYLIVLPFPFWREVNWWVDHNTAMYSDGPTNGYADIYAADYDNESRGNADARWFYGSINSSMWAVTWEEMHAYRSYYQYRTTCQIVLYRSGTLELNYNKLNARPERNVYPYWQNYRWDDPDYAEWEHPLSNMDSPVTGGSVLYDDREYPIIQSSLGSTTKGRYRFSATGFSSDAPVFTIPAGQEQKVTTLFGKHL